MIESRIVHSQKQTYTSEQDQVVAIDEVQTSHHSLQRTTTDTSHLREHHASIYRRRLEIVSIREVREIRKCLVRFSLLCKGETTMTVEPCEVNYGII